MDFPAFAQNIPVLRRSLPAGIVILMPHSSLFRSYSAYLKERYGEPVYRVSIDAGFSCPHRGDDRSHPGCSYCDEHGSRAPYLSGDISKQPTSNPRGKSWRLKRNGAEIQRQVTKAIQFLRGRYSAKLYILYFQAFSNTYAPLRRLKRIYDFTLSLAPFKEMIVSTRPDCIDIGTANLLASYKDLGLDIWVELGLQSASNQTLKRINRCHTVETFSKAYQLLKSMGLKLTVHIIFGLPDEGEKEILNTIRFVSHLMPDGIKIHNLHIPTGSPMFYEFSAGEIIVPTYLRHLQYCIKALEMLPQKTIIMRLTCDTPQSRLASPRGFRPKAYFYERLRSEMKQANTWQGKKYIQT